MNKKILFTILLTGWILGNIGCKSSGNIMGPADKAYANEKYFVASNLYKKNLAKVADKLEKAKITYRVGECYRLMNNAKLAEQWYVRAINTGYPDPEVYVKLAEQQKIQEKFEEAEENYKTYLEKYPNDVEAVKGLKACSLINLWSKKPLYFEVAPEVAINTKDPDFAPCFYGKGIIFTSSREKVKGNKYFEYNGKGYSNLYASYKNQRNRWEKPEPLSKDINTPYNEGSATFDPANNILYYTQCNGRNGKSLGCGIYKTSQSGKNWSKPELVKIPTIDSTMTIGNPSVTADGKRLYFVAELEGGMGGKDIYYVDKVGDGWGTPVNLGAPINTAGDENFPFIHTSGNLYFSSNGYEGIGGYDLFYAEPNAKGFEAPINLKYPVNSTSDDISFVLDTAGEQGYFASNRPGGRGDDDIYYALAIPMDFSVSGKVMNAQTNKIIPEAKIEIIASDGKEETITADKTGKYKFKLKKNTSYAFNVSKQRFFGDNGSLSTIGLKESKDFELDFRLNPIPLKDIVLKGILYDLNSADLRSESITILDSLIKTLNTNPNFVIEIASHTDSRADSAYNQDLSQRRAQSVVNYLITKSIDSARLVAKGYGESQLLNECKDGVECTEEQHQQNRRTSFRVLSEDYVPPKKNKQVPGRNNRK